jgi:hypothetical protein
MARNTSPTDYAGCDSTCNKIVYDVWSVPRKILLLHLHLYLIEPYRDYMMIPVGLILFKPFVLPSTI